mgnify:CR=1 FL=1
MWDGDKEWGGGGGGFFFQAEDGIRDRLVTGVQTCALPIYNKDVPNHAVVFEGLEDALSLRTMCPGSWFFVATDKAGLKHVTGFFENKKFKECLIIADHDTDVRPEFTGQALAWQLGQTLEHIGIKVTVKCHPNLKKMQTLPCSLKVWEPG